MGRPSSHQPPHPTVSSTLAVNYFSHDKKMRGQYVELICSICLLIFLHKKISYAGLLPWNMYKFTVQNKLGIILLGKIHKMIHKGLWIMLPIHLCTVWNGFESPSCSAEVTFGDLQTFCTVTPQIPDSCLCCLESLQFEVHNICRALGWEMLC